MATRFCGALRISVSYTNRGDYKATVSTAANQKLGLNLWSGRVGAPPAGFGPGVAYDSPEALDSTAHAALSFAASENYEIESLADMDARGWVITRAKPARG